MNSSLITLIEKELLDSFDTSIIIESHSAMSGGCINNCFRLNTTTGPFFLKLNQNMYPGMFQAEAAGLTILNKDAELTIPKPICFYESDNTTFLVTSFLHEEQRSSTFDEEFGRALAALHKNSAPQFGLDHDNYIGSLPQQNSFMDSWTDFFISQRLMVQIERAQTLGLIESNYLSRFEKLFQELPNLIPQEQPSLLHGDLWGGNVMCAQGKPAIYDPAVYFGHREVDLAMTKLFGGFSRSFYDSYHETFPLEPGWEERLEIHNLYPLLVHVNLFGPSYLGQIETVLKKY